MLNTKLNNREKGSVSIEATIALTSFLFMFIMIYSIITICRAQAHIQVALNSTAKEISQYSYLYGLTGMDASLAKFQEGAEGTKDEINGVVGNVVGMFEGMQAIEKDVADIEIGSTDALMAEWDKISEDLDKVEGDYTAVKAQIEAMAKDPKNFLLGMAKLIGSEALEVAKSRAIAEPVARTLMQKHLKRSESDTADAFCKSVGVVQGTYFGVPSYFNGLDFSNSTLFPYGSDEITIIVTYKVKILQLLPVDLEFHITQSAVTKGWLHGDMSSGGNSPEERIKEIQEKGNSIWNVATLDERVTLIRNMGITQLKDEGYYGVSGETYIQAYDPAANSFVLISSANPLYGLDSMSEVKKEDIKLNLSRLASQMKSATDNKTKIRIKKQDSNGNFVTEEKDCSATKNKKVIVVIPEDEGLKAIFETVAAELGSDVVFEFQPGYGKVFETTPAKEEGGKE